jgi:hypothetical protein
MISIEILREIASERPTGPRPEFSLPNIVKTIMTVGKTRGVGRLSLSKEVGVGEGAMRTIIERLKRRELITVTAKGCDLTRKGLEIYGDLEAKLIEIADVEGTELGMGEKYSALLLRGVLLKYQPLWNYRDVAVRFGATGAILMFSADNRLTIPSVTDNADTYAPKLVKDLRKMRIEKSDTVIVCGADNYRKAEEAVIAVAISMIEGT